MKKMVNLIAASFVVPFVLNAACSLCSNGGHDINQEYYPKIRPTTFHPSKYASKRSLSYKGDNYNNSQNRFYSASNSYNKQSRLHQNQQGKFLTDSDEEILIEVRDILGDRSLTDNGRDFEVEVINGEITVRGSVLTNEEKEKIQKELETITGAKAVNLNLHIQNQSGDQASNKRGNTYYYQANISYENNNMNNGNGRESVAAQSNGQRLYSDKELQDRIDDKIRGSWFSKNFNHVRVKVMNSEVTLRGTVDSRDDLSDLLKRINTVPGIKEINNQINVKEETSQRQKSSYYYRPFF